MKLSYWSESEIFGKFFLFVPLENRCFLVPWERWSSLSFFFFPLGFFFLTTLWWWLLIWLDHSFKVCCCLAMFVQVNIALLSYNPVKPWHFCVMLFQTSNGILTCVGWALCSCWWKQTCRTCFQFICFTFDKKANTSAFTCQYVSEVALNNGPLLCVTLLCSDYVVSSDLLGDVCETQ